MKKLQLLLLAMLVVSLLAACQKPGTNSMDPEEPERSSSESAAEPLPDPSTPEGAVTELLLGAKEWDIAAIDAHLPDGVSITGKVPSALTESVAAILGRMEYQVGRSTVVGDTAVVEVEVTTVDAEGAINEAIGQAVGVIARQQLTGQATGDYTAVIEEVLTSVDIDALPLTTSTVTVHMVREGDGEWELDVADENNQPFLNAVSGGALEIAERLRELAESYGIPLEGLSL